MNTAEVTTHALKVVRRGLDDALTNPHRTLREGLMDAHRALRDLVSSTAITDCEIWNLLATIEGGLVQDDLTVVKAYAKVAQSKLPSRGLSPDACTWLVKHFHGGDLDAPLVDCGWGDGLGPAPRELEAAGLIRRVDNQWHYQREGCDVARELLR